MSSHLLRVAVVAVRVPRLTPAAQNSHGRDGVPALPIVDRILAALVRLRASGAPLRVSARPVAPPAAAAEAEAEAAAS